MTDQTGAVIERHDYLPFGDEVTAPQSGQTRQFTGKERDAETGLDYFGARYYSGGRARFSTVDPYYSWSENLVDPQRWNRYAYVRNNPFRFTDPDGRNPLIVGLVGAGIGAVAAAAGSVGAQLVTTDGSWASINFRDVSAAAAGGLVSGGLAGLTLGTSLGAQTGVTGVIAIAGGTNVVGGVVTRALESKGHGAFNGREMAFDAAGFRKRDSWSEGCWHRIRAGTKPPGHRCRYA